MYQTHYVPAYTNHLVHLVLTLVTFGLWFPVWVTVWLINHNRTVARQVWVPVPYQPAYESYRLPYHPNKHDRPWPPTESLPALPPQVP